jgi:hypothetical protein
MARQGSHTATSLRRHAFEDRLIVAVVLILSIGVATVQADEIVIVSGRDNTLYESTDGSNSNGAGTAMFAGRNSQSENSIRRTLLWFDIAGALPSAATIASVELVLHDSAANDQDETLTIHRVLQNWGEGSSTATGGQGSGTAATPGDATWLHTSFDTDFWDSPGGDIDPIASASLVMGGQGYHTWPSTPELVADAQSWLDGPGANFGWIIIGNENAASSAKRFATREEPDELLRPRLLIQFTPPAAVPALSAWGVIMTALSLLAVGTMVAMRVSIRTNERPSNR